MMNGLEPELNGVTGDVAVENGVSDIALGRADERNECAVGHRMQAVRSVLSLVVDEGCVFAGLQGGDIVVSTTYNWVDVRNTDRPI